MKKASFICRSTLLGMIFVSFSFLLSAQLPPHTIRLNQVGFYPNAGKVAIITAATGDSFIIREASSRKIVFHGSLGSPTKSSNSSLVTKTADFSSFTKPGEYVMAVSGSPDSAPFGIANTIHSTIGKSSLKAFYYQRTSMPLHEQFAGKWARPAGHPDTSIQIHPSAASASRPAGTIISSPGGWYDAGDYNKYIVNSGITMGELLSAYEDFPVYFNQLVTQIPESSDKVPDLLNEILYNLRWMFTMQDPGDGGVYNKCTNANFDGMVMPGVTKWPRYVVQKGTAATLDFAAVMAQASRIYARFSRAFPRLSDSCLKAARQAWQWSVSHPSMVYDQQAINLAFDPDINTGGYGDRNFSDERYWAAAELFITTLEKKYFDELQVNNSRVHSLPSWASVGMLGYYSLIRSGATLPSYASAVVQSHRAYIIRFADSLLANMKKNAFQTVMGGGKADFVWGSSAVAANQGIALINAWSVSKNKDYLTGALSNLDYLLGRNATGYCFLTGAGFQSPMHPHHRPSVADGIMAPVPGMLAGGPNPGMQDKCTYKFTEPETSYVDVECSYASNEIAINWNAPLVYLANALEALQFEAGWSKK